MNKDRKRILIVDDDAKSRIILEMNLKAMECDSVSVNNGEEAMETLASDPYFDLIITDIMMPYMTGFEFAAKLKEYVETRDIPLIATSAFHDWEKARQTHELKVDGFVPKPVDRNVLRSEILRVLGGRAG